MSNENNAYDSSNIEVLKGLEPVRHRPGMYIGSTDRKGLHHLVWEIVDNSVDEALAEYCDEIKISLNGREITVSDNGRGIPVSTHQGEGVSAATLVFTVLHAGGKFGGGGYKTSGGLHGVGASVTNALSEWLVVQVKRDGFLWEQKFARGKIVTDLVKVRALEANESTGTIVSFKPDEEIFGEDCNDQGGMDFDFATIASRLKRTSYLTKGLSLVIEEGARKERYYSENGLKDMISEQLSPEPDSNITDVLTGSDTENDVFIELAFAFTKKYDRSLKSFVNNIDTRDGGTHETGFTQALTFVVNEYAQKNLDINKNFSADDIMEGMRAAISLRLVDPKFVGQTKDKLSSSEARKAVYSFTKRMFSEYLEQTPDIAKVLVNRAISAQKAKEAALKSREKVRRESVMNSLGTLPGKLADCQTKDLEKSELYIVEGDSAGGSAKQGRDRNFQAILPLRGKVLNTEKSDLDKLENSEQIQNLVSALGTGIGDDFNVEKLRYGKIIIMTDADVDGSHIAVLLLTFFVRYMPELLRQGRVYLATPPLFRLKRTGGKAESRYYFSDEEIEKDFPNSKDGIKGWDKSRFKGLGEMDPEQLWETTMSPETRLLQRVAFNESNEQRALADFDMLMGKEVPPRRQFLEENAKNANIDI